MNWELPDVQAGFQRGRRGRGIRDQTSNFPRTMEKSREFQKNIYFCFIDSTKASDCVKVKVKSLSRVRLFATPWTVAHQAPPSMGFSRQEYWSGLPFPSLIVWFTKNHGKSLKRWEYHTTLPVPWKRADQEATESDMERMTSPKLVKEYLKVVYSPPAYLTSMRSTSCEMLGWMQQLESRLPGEISTTSDMQMIPL